MGVVVQIDSTRVEFSNFAFDEASKAFVSEAESSTGMSLYVQTPLSLDKSFEGKNFHVFFLSKKGLRESEIFQFFDGSRDRRIGWCIPVNALDSNDHDYANNLHFLRYAYVGIKCALNSIDNTFFYTSHNATTDMITSLSAILPESTALLIISVETLDQEFDIGMWLPELATLGYFQLTNIDPNNIQIERPIVSDKAVKAFPVSKLFANTDYLTLIYSRSLPFERNPVFQFFYLYQVVEQVMELIFRLEHTTFVSQLIEKQDDIGSTKDIIDAVRSNVSEKARLSRLVQKYCCCEKDCEDLIKMCNCLLGIIRKPNGNHLESTLYPIRNFLFHQHRDFPSTADEQLNEVVYSLLDLVPKILAKFRDPNSEIRLAPAAIY
jgi:hypothetical protein